MFSEDTSIGPLQNMTEYQGSHNRIIERSDNGDELRYQVDRVDKPCHCKTEPELGASGHSRVAE